VDDATLLPYREAKNGQILEEGITEAGALASWIAAGTAYANLGIEMVPFFTFYSQFGLPRVWDLLWAGADARAKGFLMGATAGRTTLSGEGLQHQDGHSQLFAGALPTLHAYDPAYAYELAVIIQHGLERMFQRGESCQFYITLYNESYPMPAMPEGSQGGILAGIHCVAERGGGGWIEILGSGPLLREAERAQAILAERFDVGSRVWSVTSYLALRREALAAERRRLLEPERPHRASYLERVFEGSRGPFVAVSDWVRQLPESIGRHLPGPLTVLGTDGFGRSDTRPALRRHFEVDAEHIAYAALNALWRGRSRALTRVRSTLGIAADAPDPMVT
jgi:pyruvate dehydrogenase E1 component